MTLVRKLAIIYLYKKNTHKGNKMIKEEKMRKISKELYKTNIFGRVFFYTFYWFFCSLFIFICVAIASTQNAVPFSDELGPNYWAYYILGIPTFLTTVIELQVLVKRRKYKKGEID